jgi:hypothetical protein
MRIAIEPIFLAHSRADENYLGNAMVTYRFSMLMFRAALTTFAHAVVGCLSGRSVPFSDPYQPRLPKP